MGACVWKEEICAVLLGGREKKEEMEEEEGNRKEVKDAREKILGMGRLRVVMGSDVEWSREVSLEEDAWGVRLKRERWVAGELVGRRHLEESRERSHGNRARGGKKGKG